MSNLTTITPCELGLPWLQKLHITIAVVAQWSHTYDLITERFLMPLHGFFSVYTVKMRGNGEGRGGVPDTLLAPLHGRP